MKSSTSLITGGFDPIHLGHIEYLKGAKFFSDHLIVGVNSDKWLIEKKGYFFMPLEDRLEIIKNLRIVDEVITFNDSDGSACDAIANCLKQFKKVIFLNGGDRKKNNIPEIIKYKKDPRLEFIFEVGGSNKINSSSFLASDFYNRYSKLTEQEKPQNDNKIAAPWGYHRVVDGLTNNFKVKKLFVNPGCQLSLQKHQYRQEHWVVVKGVANVEIENKEFIIEEGQYIHIPLGKSHRLSNTTSESLVVVEVQFGEVLDESDIERLEDSYGRVN